VLARSFVPVTTLIYGPFDKEFGRELVDIYTTAIVVSLVVYIAIGNYAGRRVKKLDDYFVAGRKAPTILIVGTLVASLISTNAFLGETGFVYEGQAGPYLLWPGIAATFYVYGALFFGRYLRRSRAITVADFLGSVSILKEYRLQPG
jgi:Na+/proline symporter